MTRSLIVATSLSLFCFAGCDFVPELPARFQKKDATEQKTEAKTEAAPATEGAAPTAEPAKEEKETSWLWRGAAQPVAYAGTNDRMLMLESGEGGEPETRHTCRHEAEDAPARMIRIGDDGIVIPGLLRIDDDGVFLNNGLRVTDEGVHIPGVVTVDDDGVVVHGVVQIDGKSKGRKARKRAREHRSEAPARRAF